MDTISLSFLFKKIKKIKVSTIALQVFLLCTVLFGVLGVMGYPNTFPPTDVTKEYDAIFQEPDIHAHLPLATDVLLQFLPYRALQIPWHFRFWNPYTIGGVPFFEDIQARTLEATNLIGNFLHISVENFFTFSAIILLWFGACSLYAWLRTWFSQLASLYGSCAFVLSLPLLLWTPYTLGTTLIWLPFLLLCIEKISQGNKRWTIALAIGVCLQLFAGHPQAALLNLLCIGLYTLWKYRITPLSNKTLVVITAVVIIGCGLSAIQTLPAFDFIKQSDVYTLGRGANKGGLVENTVYQLTHSREQIRLGLERVAHRGVLFFAPNFYGSPVTANYHYPENPLSNNYFEVSIYTGIATALLACLGFILIVYRRERVHIFWAGAWIVGFLLMSNVPFLNNLTLLPIISKIHFGRLTYAVVLTTCLLATYAIDAIQRALQKRAYRVTALIIPIVLLVFLFADTYVHAHPLNNPAHTPIASIQQNDAISFLQRQPEARIIGLGAPGLNLHTALLPNLSSMAQLKDIRGYLVMIPEPFRQLAERYLSRKRNYFLADDIYAPKFLDIYGVRYIICGHAHCTPSTKKFPEIYSTKTVDIRENTHALPLAYLAYNLEGVTTTQDIFAEIESPLFNPSQSTLVPPLFARTSALPIEPVTTQHVGDSIWITAQAREEGFLVLNENFYPGWQATVDSQRVDIVPVYSAQIGVPLQAGTHTIHLKYQPRTWKIAVTISTGSLIALLLFWWNTKKQRPRDNS